MTTRRLSIDGYGYQYRMSGRVAPGRPPLLLLGGAFQSMESWRPFASHFEQYTLVMVADLPGAGDSDVLPRRYGLDFLAESARKVLDDAGVERAALIGASYGSPIAYRLGQLYPSYVEGMALGGVMKQIPQGRAERTARTVATLQDGRLADFARDVVGGLLCPDPGDRIERSRFAARVLTRQLRAFGGEHRDRYIENTARLLLQPPLDLARPPSVRALVFTGEHDVYTRPDDCREIAEALPCSTFVLIERADHLFHLERFDVTLRLLDAFARNLPFDQLEGCRVVPTSAPCESDGRYPPPVLATRVAADEPGAAEGLDQRFRFSRSTSA